VGVRDAENGAMVLVVDDEPNILELLTAALRLSGFEARAADNGAHAVTLFAVASPDIVVLDVMLPDRPSGAGPDAVHAIRRPVALATPAGPQQALGDDHQPGNA
jgi:two-component system, OmpR family, response regulator